MPDCKIITMNNKPDPLLNCKCMKAGGYRGPFTSNLATSVLPLSKFLISRLY